MIQLILHLIGDYVLQSQWMAENKTKSSFAAGAHAITYSLPFLFLQPSWMAFTVILGTHFLIDRYSLAKYVVWLKNAVLQPYFMMPLAVGGDEGDEIIRLRKLADTGVPLAQKVIAIRDRYKWGNCSGTGYPSDLQPWLAVWLLIAADNTLHLAINYAALRWL